MTDAFDREAIDRSPGAFHQRAIEWVLREVQIDEMHREALSKALFESMHSGIGDAVRDIHNVWPASAQWPRGRDFLREEIRVAWEEEGDWSPGDQLPDVPVRDLLKLLRMRVSRTSHRMFRAAQIQEFYAEPSHRASHPWIEINRFLDAGQDYCRRGTRVRVPVEAGLWLMGVESCDHPACQCTFDPEKHASGQERA